MNKHNIQEQCNPKNKNEAFLYELFILNLEIEVNKCCI